MPRELVPIISLSLVLYGCGSLIETQPMHDPISPADGESVEFSLLASASEGIERIRLLAKSQPYDAEGEEPLEELQSWTFDNVNSMSVSYPHDEGYEGGQMVTYVWEVESRGRTRSHDVMFAVRPYPPASVPELANRKPVPAYVQGDVGNAKNVVFIPDGRLTGLLQSNETPVPNGYSLSHPSLGTFLKNCRLMIRDAMWADETVRAFTRGFNYYVNPAPGFALDFWDFPQHVPPVNSDNVSFANLRMLMHQETITDHTQQQYASTPMVERGTMLHESGHAIFGLRDEYGLKGANLRDHKHPNNWCTEEDALGGPLGSAGPSKIDDSSVLYWKDGDIANAHDCTEWGLEVDTPYYKNCSDDCQMFNSGQGAFSFDRPCRKRIEFEMSGTLE